PERNIYRGTVVQSTNAHREYVLRGFGRLCRKARHQVRMQRSRLEHARATSREPQEVGCAYGVNPQKSIEDRGYEESSASMWFVCLLVLVRVRIVSFPYACGLIGLANRIAQGASKACRSAEFPSELA